MKKIFINANQLLDSSFALAKQIVSQNFKPDIIVGVWRGGSSIAIAIHEYFEYVGWHCDHTAIRASSYSLIDQQNTHVELSNLDYLIDKLKTDRRVLLVDDVFDTGGSVDAIIKRIHDLSDYAHKAEIKVATPWFKPERNQQSFGPDFYLYQTNDWLVFPHELLGLSEQEIRSGKEIDWNRLKPD